MPDLTDEIEANAAGPQEAQGDQGRMKQHSLPDQIEADRYLKADDAAKTQTGRGLRFNRFRNPGAE